MKRRGERVLVILLAALLALGGSAAAASTSRTGAPVTPVYNGVGIGSVVRMGTYEQDNNLYNGTEPIEWLVVDIRGNNALLVSRYGLDAVAYHTRRTSITWETSAVRGWLNYDFKTRAFSWEEQQAIIQTYVDNSYSQCNPDPDYVHDGGNGTWDELFLLSYREASMYFSSDYERRCAPTAYAYARGVYRETGYYTPEGQISGSWWLRSPGMKQDQASAINVGGGFSRDGIEHASDAARPAMWVNLDLCSFSATPNGGGSAVPYSWDTQFKAGAAYNEKSINILGRIYDGQPTPAFYYINWRSQRTDSIPEFTAYFNGATLSSIGIINGNTLSPTEYQNRARVKEMRVVAHTSYGEYSTYINVPDYCTQSTQYFAINAQGAVYSVDIFIVEIYQGQTETYEVNIGEIAFR